MPNVMGRVMLSRNLIRILIVLIITNLVFMAGLEIQRRTIWNQEAAYLRKIEAFILASEKSEERYTYIQRLLVDIQQRVYAVQFATRENEAAIGQIRDIRERVNHLEVLMMAQQPANSSQGGQQR